MKALFLAYFQIYACAECRVEHGSVLQMKKRRANSWKGVWRRSWDNYGSPPPRRAKWQLRWWVLCLRRAAHKARWVVFSISQLNGWEALMGKLGHFYLTFGRKSRMESHTPADPSNESIYVQTIHQWNALLLQ